MLRTFVQDVSVAGSLNSIKDYWDKLTAIAPKYGCFLNMRNVI